MRLFFIIHFSLFSITHRSDHEAWPVPCWKRSKRLQTWQNSLKQSNKISSIPVHPSITHNMLSRTIINKWFRFVISLEFEIVEHGNLTFQLVKFPIETSDLETEFHHDSCLVQRALWLVDDFGTTWTSYMFGISRLVTKRDANKTTGEPFLTVSSMNVGVIWVGDLILWK